MLKSALLLLWVPCGHCYLNDRVTACSIMRDTWPSHPSRPGWHRANCQTCKAIANRAAPLSSSRRQRAAEEATTRRTSHRALRNRDLVTTLSH